MEIYRKLRILLVVVAASFAVTTVSISPAWSATDSSKHVYKKAAKRHVLSGARRIKEINGTYVAQNKPQTVAVAPAAACYGGWTQSWNGPVYVSWCPATTFNGGNSGQTSGWAAPAQASGGQNASTPATGSNASQPQQVNVAGSPTSVCYYNSWTPCSPGAVCPGNTCYTAQCY